MEKIHVLSFAVANLIAAGEVVDRPASVIKELVENALDAGSDRIVVEIQNGGVTFMRVTDNGCGMSPADLPVAIKRHATSKIQEAEDLDGIMTLGFRGEALAAISSVSHIRILTKTRDALSGAMLDSVAGENVRVTECGCADGTTVIVEDLFANVPARRKFLKKDMTEAMAVTANVEKLALSHPEVGFRLISDGSTRLDTSGDGDLKHTIHSVFGKDFASRMIPVEGQDDSGGIRVSGFIGRSDNVKANRNYQNYFINGRYVKSKAACAAVEQAFCSYLPPEKFPVCVLNITIHPGAVDVNVHPAKLEVKFSNEKPVFEAIYYTVKNALEQNITRPELKVDGTRTGDHLTAEQARALLAEESKKGARMSEAFVPVADRMAESETASKKQLQMPLSVRTGKEEDADPVVRIPDQVRPLGETFRQAMNDSDTRTVWEREQASLAKGGESRGTMGQEQSEKPFRASLSATDFDMTVPFAMPDRSWGEQSNTEKSNGTAIDVPAEAAKAQQNVENFILTIPSIRQKGSDEPGTVIGQTDEETQEPRREYRILGEVFYSYVLVESEGRLLIIDKHAAHERIIFEQLKAALKKKEQVSQLLMLPVAFIMSYQELQMLSDFREEIEAIGFTFAIRGRQVEVSGIPNGISPDAVEDMFATFAEREQRGTGSATLTRDIIFEKTLYQASCKAAIKAGRNYADGHIQWICEQLMRLPDITFCPHGRPVAMELTKANLDHQFKRT